jgi:NAD(P)-dependent dehydrogenase (short-subunit alcohol dehydrogenase family)
MPDFEGLRALVTGEASGIGLTTARLLAAEGATVSVLDREPFADAEYDHPHFVRADVTDDAAVRRAVEAAIAQARQPRGRLVSPDEVASAITYLASSAAGSVTGVTLAVDGGMETLWTRSRR